ncbi:unnamed protein product [Thelazia callipaeda]|uniref:Mitochondrial 2-oxoglutarate/malate carrier protein n=1 Tax=Thelazia callipaeda TaxID=103827 RepID=A0A0N5CJD9_THECL|nr:unnamed protein product [Thelazia callipaeda]
MKYQSNGIPNASRLPNSIKFIFGGAAGMGATLIVQPLDLLKNRMQLSELTSKKYRSSFHVLRSIVAKEGFFAIYDGLSAGLLRQATYTTTRLGIYTWLFEKFSNDGKKSNFGTKAAIGLAAGAAGSFVGTPADVALVRMCADGRLPPQQQHKYKNVFDALVRVVREEGFFKLWRGCGLTVLRAMVVNSTQLATYSEAKEALLTTQIFGENVMLHFVASMISGLATTVTSMPVDIVKTRVQNMRIVGEMSKHYGTLDVLFKVIRNEGFFSLWKGFTPYYFRLGPHTVLTFIILEQLNAFYFNHISEVKQTRSIL